MYLNLLTGIELLTFGFSIFFIVFLLQLRSGNLPALRLLAFFLFIVACESLNFLIYAMEWALSYPSLANSFNNFGILFGTTMYFYTRAMTQKDFSLSVGQWPHLLPFIFLLVYNLWFYHRYDHQTQLGILSGKPSLWLDYVPWVIALGHSVILTYLVLAIRTLHLNGLNLRYFLSDIEPYNLSWLRAVLGLFFLVWMIRVSKILLQPFDIDGMAITLIQSTITLCSVIALIFQALKQHPVYDLSDEQGTQEHAELEHIVTVMNEQKLWREATLSLADFSEACGLQTKTVSTLLNDRMKVNFFEYVNSLRCIEAIERLKSSEESILDIAFAVGFNSKTAFNRAFKRHFSQTPSQARKQAADF